MNESNFAIQVRRYALDLGWLYYHTFSSRRSAPGFPDCTFARPDCTFLAELKGDSGHPLSVEQARWLVTLYDSGMEVYLWRPRDMTAIVDRLARRGYTTPRPALPAEVYAKLGLEAR